MNERVQCALDGDLSRNELLHAESAELDESRVLFDRVVRSIPAQQLPPLGQSVLRRIDAIDGFPNVRSSEPEHEAGTLRWLWSPTRISIPLRPAYGLALAAAVALVVGIAGTSSDRVVPRRNVAIASREVLVHFRLEAPTARAVSLAGDFSNWAPTYAMKRTEPGVWTIVVPLEPGVHDYSFIVDGERWVPDPAAPARADGFGGINSRVAVLAPDSRRSL
jgi:hypothetical protein